MGSKKRSSQKQKTDMTTTATVTGIAPYQQKFNQEYKTLRNLYNQQEANKPVLDYSNPLTQEGLDPLVQNTISRGIQNLKAQENAANMGLSRSLSTAGGNNGALLAALQRQSALNTAGNANALAPAALEQQRALNTEKANLINTQNQLRLAEAQQGSANLTQRSSLLNALNQMAQTSAGKKVREKGVTSSKGKVSSGFF